MFIDLGVIGVPLGFASSIDDRKVSYEDMLMSNFYRDEVRNAGKQMRIIKRADGFVLYVFTIGGNGGRFSDVNGRPGSFFGIVFAPKDFECVNPVKVYNLLNHVYETKVKGRFISDDGAGRQWMINSDNMRSMRQKLTADVSNMYDQFINLKTDMRPYKFNPRDANSLLYNPPTQADTPPTNQVAPVEPVASVAKRKSGRVQKFDAAIDTLKQMGINPNDLAAYIVAQEQKQ